jgi:hypothetical protein
MRIRTRKSATLEKHHAMTKQVKEKLLRKSHPLKTFLKIFIYHIFCKILQKQKQYIFFNTKTLTFKNVLPEAVMDPQIRIRNQKVTDPEHWLSVLSIDK